MTNRSNLPTTPTEPDVQLKLYTGAFVAGITRTGCDTEGVLKYVVHVKDGSEGLSLATTTNIVSRESIVFIWSEILYSCPLSSDHFISGDILPRYETPQENETVSPTVSGPVIFELHAGLVSE